MAGNTRGKIKEHLEGLHRNHEWQLDHSQKILDLIAGRNPKLTEAIESYAHEIQELDKLVLALYSTI